MKKYTPLTFFKNSTEISLKYALEEEIRNSKTLTKFTAAMTTAYITYSIGPENMIDNAILTGMAVGISNFGLDNIKNKLNYKRFEESTKKLSELARYYENKNSKKQRNINLNDLIKVSENIDIIDSYKQEQQKNRLFYQI